MNELSPRDTENDRLVTYAYSYPHKSSYRPLTPPVPLRELWRDEEVGQLSLYVHVPFCEMRCGFCNLFTQSQPHGESVDAYLATLIRQMRVVRSEVPRARFDQFGIGGGTPTFLTPSQLRRLLDAIEQTFGQSLRHLPTSVETSPATATPDRLRVLADFGVERVSLGVQSFLETETRNFGRPQHVTQVHQALQAIREFRFPVLNIDLIYGDPGQTLRTWRQSLNEALRYAPEELYLYPLYIRPETGLARTGHSAVQHRSDLYRLGCEVLGEAGYVQTSLRGFRLPRNQSPSTYACQRDGMIGLGCGARSYTRGLHYATRFAVTQAGVRAIIQDWTAQSDRELALATHGYELSQDEQRRRFTIMSLLQTDGMPLSAYVERFHGSPQQDIPELLELQSQDWLECHPERLKLTAEGLEHSDEVGPILYSEVVRSRLREFVRL